MFSELRKIYIEWGWDISPRDSNLYRIHIALRTAWRIVKFPYTLAVFCGYCWRYFQQDRTLWYRIERCFFPVLGYSLPASIKRQPRPVEWYHFHYHFTYPAEHALYNIDYAVQAAEVKGLALIYFMGMGDYLYTTPFVAALKQRYPHLPIIAYVSKNACGYNAPMTAVLLQQNPNIDAVHMYDGKREPFFKNYNYEDALRQVPNQYLAMPVLYEHLPSTRHRVATLFGTFGLEMPIFLPRPRLYLPETPAPHVEAMVRSIQKTCAEQKAEGVIFLQLDARSSEYHYPYTDRLVSALNALGFFVVSASRLSRSSDMAVELDLKQFSINDSIHLLKLLRDTFQRTYVVSVVSVFWAISSGLGIPNLSMHHFVDVTVHTVWYPNIYVITHYDYPTLPLSRQLLAKKTDYELNKRSQATFKPDFVMNCFDVFRQDIENIR